MRYLISFLNFFYYLIAPKEIMPDKNFVPYLIKKGHHYCKQSVFRPVHLRTMKFIGSFNETAVYQTTDPANQADINKLYGFTDGCWNPHKDSARFGWSYENELFHLHAYVYSKGIRSNQLVLSLKQGQLFECNIMVTTESYYFFAKQLTGEEEQPNMGEANIPRLRMASVNIRGLMLYPYFGGGETPSHDIIIQLQKI